MVLVANGKPQCELTMNTPLTVTVQAPTLEHTKLIFWENCGTGKTHVYEPDAKVITAPAEAAFIAV
jgi:hypothetical protein